MGNKASYTYNAQHSIRKSLKKIPFRAPNERVKTTVLIFICS